MSYHSSFRLAWPLRFAVLALIGALVSGCVAIPKNPLTAEQIKSLSIEEVTVITVVSPEVV